MEKIYTDIAIIGGGAAGLASAVVLGQESDYSVVLLEQGARTGKKLLTTGNGRCNLSHRPLFGGKDCYRGEASLAERIIKEAVSPEDFFNTLGLRCRADGEGRVYPYSNTAASVLDALRLSMLDSGVREICGFTAVKLEPLMEGFVIHSDNPENPRIAARRVIISTGGKAVSDGYPLLRNLGVELTKLYPSLCPVITDEKLTRPLKNLRVKATVNVYENCNKIASEKGEVQFGEGILSGIAVFNLSHFVFSPDKQNGEDDALVFSLDLAPEMNNESLTEYLDSMVKIRKNFPLSDLLTGLLHKRIGECLIKRITDKPFNKNSSVLTEEEKKELARLIKGFEFPVKRLKENDIPKTIWQSAQVTGGGIPLQELCENMSLKKYPHIYTAGEVVNVTGACGGYNLAWAWASGQAAAYGAVRSLKNV